MAQLADSTSITSPAARMAAVMVARTTAQGACTEEDLRIAGFTKADIRRFGDKARARASHAIGDQDLAS